MNETFDYIHQINANGNETGRITDTKDHFDRFMLCANGRNGTDGFPVMGRLPNYIYRYIHKYMLLNFNSGEMNAMTCNKIK